MSGKNIDKIHKSGENSIVLFEDSWWLALDKPAGLNSHASNTGDLGVTEWMDLYHGEKIHLISRLDKTTSGVLLCARTKEASARAQEIHESEEAEKSYHCIVRNEQNPLGNNFSCDIPIDGKKAETSFSVLKQGKGFLLLEARLHRGRKHQIRRHLSELGMPIYGDSEYGGPSASRLYLHCSAVKWPGIETVILSSLPLSFDHLLAEGREDPIGICLERRLPWLASVTNAYRLIHRGELDDLDISVEQYGEYLSVSLYDERDEQSAFQLTEQIIRRVGAEGALIRMHNTNPHGSQLATKSTVIGSVPEEPFWVHEAGAWFQVRLQEKKHTGLFLDQRDSRRRAAMLAGGRRIANLFAFSCSFSVVTAMKQAEVVFSVDLAKSALKIGMSNFERNGLQKSGIGKFVAEDVRNYLTRQIRKKHSDGTGFDLIICDPPVFSSGKKNAFSVEESWEELVRLSRELLNSGGSAIFSNNHRSGSSSRYEGILKKHFTEVQPLQPPLDFPVLRKETVRIYLCS
jgi:23S rRNA G2069 N7-methylase RlmK/C1962 C5-methylase RlmI